MSFSSDARSLTMHEKIAIQDLNCDRGIQSGSPLRMKVMGPHRNTVKGGEMNSTRTAPLGIPKTAFVSLTV